jgi:hypothetical protein
MNKRMAARQRKIERNFPRLPPDLEDQYLRERFGDEFANDWLDYLADQRETREMLKNPTSDNVIHAYVRAIRWAKYWQENAPFPEHREMWREFFEEMKPVEAKVNRVVKRWIEKQRARGQ